MNRRTALQAMLAAVVAPLWVSGTAVAKPIALSKPAQTLATGVGFIDFDGTFHWHDVTLAGTLTASQARMMERQNQ